MQLKDGDWPTRCSSISTAVLTQRRIDRLLHLLTRCFSETPQKLTFFCSFPS